MFIEIIIHLNSLKNKSILLSLKKNVYPFKQHYKVLIFLVYLISFDCKSQVGKIDLGFGINGKIELNNLLDVEFYDIITRDEKIYLLGNYKNGEYLFVRLNQKNGSIDSTFGNNGFSSGYLSNLNNPLMTSIFTSNNDILLLSNAPNNFVKFTNNGDYIVNSLEESCDSFELQPNFERYYILYPNSPKLHLNRFNNVVLASSGTKDISGSQHSGFIVAYFDENGILDNNINDGRIYFSPLYDCNSLNSTTIIEENGNIFSANSYDGGLNIIRRFLPNCTLDSTFGHNGITRLPLELFIDNFYTAIKMKDGSYFLSGNKQGNILVAKLNSAGILDSTFNNKGYKIFDYNNQSDNILIHTNSLAQDSISDKLILSFNTSALSSNIQSVTYRLNKNGTIDNTFGNNGATILRNTDGVLIFKKITIQDDGKILLLFHKYIDDTYYPYLVRLNGNTVSNIYTQDDEINVDLFPNPFNNRVILNFTYNSITQLNIRIFNSIGAVLFENLALTSVGKNNFSLDLSKLNNGVYFIQLNVLGGSKYYSKIIKH